jgi:hypothetical protein
MNEPLPILMENSIQIAWDYLELTGDIDEPAATSRFLSDYLDGLIRRGERRLLILSNKAITAYRSLKRSGRRRRVCGFGRLARGVPAIYGAGAARFQGRSTAC